MTATSQPGGGEKISLSLKLPTKVLGDASTCTSKFGSTSYIRSWTGNFNIQAWSKPGDFVEPIPCGTTTINITKIGDRTGPGLTDGAPLAGATYTAYASTGGSNPAPTGPALGTCVTSPAGTCSIAILNMYANGVWIQETGTPAGWSNLPSLGIGDYDTSKSVTPYRFRVDVGTGKADQTKNVTSDRNRPNTDVSGAWVNMRNNPQFPQTCGLSIATVFDTSSSISSSEMTSFKDAAKLFVGAGGLGGTPSHVTMFQFSTAASVLGGGTVYDLSTAGPIGGNTGYNGAINRIETSLPSQGDGYTNWDAALRLVKSTGDYDLVLFLTDGDPTTYGDGSSTNLTVQFRAVEQAVMSANAVKAETGPSGSKTKIVGVGVGLSNGSDGNLAAITGPTSGEDYFLTGDFGALKQKLGELALRNCGSTLTVVKQIQNPAGQVISTNTAGWTFTATGDVVPGGSAAQTTTTSGTNFQLNFNDANTHTVTVAETAKPGYTFVSASCTNAAGTATQTSTGFTVPLTHNLITSCTVINREVPPPATVELDKTWVVKNTSGVTLSTYYERGNAADPASPAWAEATPTLTPQIGTQNLAWGTANTGYTAGQQVTPGEESEIDQQAAPGCMIVSQQLTRVNGQTVAVNGLSTLPGISTFGAQTLVAGANLFVITNTVVCDTKLTLLKQLDTSQAPNTSLQPSNWTLTAKDAAGATPLNGVTGATAPSAENTASVTADTAYEVSEASLSSQLAYVQLGIQRCATVVGFGPTATCSSWDPGYISGDEITVALGEHEIYRFVNQAIPPLAVPRTGGVGSDLITIWGGSLLLLALLGGVIIERRNGRVREVK